MDKAKFEKMVDDITYDLNVAGVRLKAFAKSFNKNMKEAFKEANEAANKYKEENKREEVQEEQPRPCNCGCCHCHDNDGDVEEKVEEVVKEAVEPDFVINEEEILADEQPKDEE